MKSYLLKSLLTLLALLVLGAALLLGYVLLKPPQQHAEVSQTDEVVIEDVDGVLPGAIYKLEPFIINLSSPGAFLLLSLELEFFDLALPEHLDRIMPRLRDKIITFFSKQTVREAMQGRTSVGLRELLRDELNEDLDEAHEITQVYITQYTVEER